jgi:hypothetical protein
VCKNLRNKRVSVLFAVLAFLLALVSLAAAPVQYGQPFEPSSVRSLAMGGTGIAKPGSTDAYYLNPAAMAYYNGQLSLPYLAFTLYNAGKLNDEYFFSDFYNGNREVAAETLYDSIGPGTQRLAKFDCGLDLAFSGFGMGLNVQVTASARDRETVFATTSIYGFLGLAQDIEFSDDFMLSIGINAKFHYLAYTLSDPMNPAPGGLGMADVKTAITDPESLFSRIREQTPVAGGFAIPVDVGVSARIWDNVYIGCAMRNINASIKNMQTYSNLSSLVYQLTGSSIGEITPEDAKDSFCLSIPSSLDFGIAWAPSEKGFFSYIRPNFALDFVDALGFIKAGNSSWPVFLSHLRLGAELRLFQLVDIRAGLNSGYPGFGIGFDLFAIRCDIVYSVFEFGESLGENPVDGLTVRFNIGFDR